MADCKGRSRPLSTEDAAFPCYWSFGADCCVTSRMDLCLEMIISWNKCMLRVRSGIDVLETLLSWNRCTLRQGGRHWDWSKRGTYNISLKPWDLHNA